MSWLGPLFVSLNDLVEQFGPGVKARLAELVNRGGQVDQAEPPSLAKHGEGTKDRDSQPLRRPHARPVRQSGAEPDRHLHGVFQSERNGGRFAFPKVEGRVHTSGGSMTVSHWGGRAGPLAHLYRSTGVLEVPRSPPGQ